MNLKAGGFPNSTNNASSTAGTRTSPTTSIRKPAPSAKKNITRKKSRNGFRFSAIYRAMGLVATATPATNAPIS